MVYKQQKLVSPSSLPGKPGIKVLTDWVSAEDLFLGSELSSSDRGARQLSGASFIRALIPFVGAPPYDLITSL